MHVFTFFDNLMIYIFSIFLLFIGNTPDSISWFL
jgi:hypothetical protein